MAGEFVNSEILVCNLFHIIKKVRLDIMNLQLEVVKLLHYALLKIHNSLKIFHFLFFSKRGLIISFKISNNVFH